MRKSLNLITDNIIKEIGNNPSYSQFYETYLKHFRKLHPNNAIPKNSLISMFYDDFIKHNQIIGY
jgi:hypothetical protein